MSLWIASVAVLIFALMPYVAGPLAAKISERRIGNEQRSQKAGKEAAALPTSGIEQATFKVEGMTCASCETTIRLALERTPGVRRADVSYVRGAATVEYDSNQTTPAELREAINKTGYKVTEEK
jgi:copper chaperone CopZ